MILFSRIFPSNLMLSVKWWFRNYDTISIDEFTRLMDDIMREGIFKTFKVYV
jgi:hypothetical protein